jgi:hypothetical protein
MSLNRPRAAGLLTLLALSVPSCRCSDQRARDTVSAEARVVETWLRTAGGRIEKAVGPTATSLTKEITWTLKTAVAWNEYRHALLASPPPGYPRCDAEARRLLCKRALPGDVFVVEVVAAGTEGSEDLVARLRASPF